MLLLSICSLTEGAVRVTVAVGFVGRLVNLIGILAVDFLPTLTTNGEKERQERGGEQERRKRNDRGITRKTILPRTFPTACTVSQKRQLEKILPACL